MSLTGGVLQWSAKRNGTTVVAPSVLGLQLSNGTTLGRSNTTVTSTRTVTAGTVLSMAMTSAGGQAVILRPAS